MSDGKVYTFQDRISSPEILHSYSSNLKESKVPLIIDNGCYQCRAGWANDTQPRLEFKNMVARMRGKKDSLLVGNDISPFDIFKCQIKTPFDRNVVMYYDVQEDVFDHIFSHLSIDTEGAVPHPIVLSEAFCNPNYFRQQMTELLFECYNVPRIAYGVDALFSFWNDFKVTENTNGIIISCGYQSTHIIPVLHGQVVWEHSRRISVGGVHCDMYMQRLLQLKHTGHLAQVSLARAEELVHRFSHLAENYQEECNKWFSGTHYDENVVKIQLPYNAAVSKVDPELQKQRRAEQARRLKQMAAKKREEKLARDQERLEELVFALNLLKEEDDDEQHDKILSGLNCASQAEVQHEINEINNRINSLVNKMQQPSTSKSEQSKGVDGAKKPKLERKSSCPEICDVPVGNEQAMKVWLENIRSQRQQLLNKKEERRKHKTDMTKRRTLASQERMKIISSLAQGKKTKKEDTFGMKDEDWNIYKEINKDAGDSDSEAEQEKLDEIESYMREYDPDFKDFSQNGGSKQFNLKEYYQLNVAVEQIRAPEVLFQPSMLGVEHGGIIEVIEFILSKFTPQERQQLVQNVYVTGGCARFPGFKKRLETDLQSILPFLSEFHVHFPQNPSTAAWTGAQKWASTCDPDSDWISKDDYQEKGGEYLKESFVTNRYFPTPAKEAESGASQDAVASQDASAS